MLNLGLGLDTKEQRFLILHQKKIFFVTAVILTSFLVLFQFPQNDASIFITLSNKNVFCFVVVWFLWWGCFFYLSFKDHLALSSAGLS